LRDPTDGYFVAVEIRRNWFVGAWVLCAGIGPVAAADHGGPTIGDLKQLNVEDLMNLQVTSVSRRPEKLI
jgi:hypothetical protein